MYHILVVDDQQAEIEAIEWLIHKHALPFSVAQANDGEVALEYIRGHHVDLLFTDIRMPFMDGLELIKQAKVVVPDLKVLIYSAYGEFEYAQKAIQLGTVNYMLKPIDVKEFLKMFQSIIAILEDERLQREKDELLIKGFHKGVAYEKEKLLFDLLQGRESDVHYEERAAFAGLNHLVNKRMYMIMIGLQNRFFDQHHTEAFEFFQSTCKYEMLFLNMNEYQSIMLVAIDPASKNSDNQQELMAYGNWVKEWLETRFDRRSFIIVGSPVDKLEGLHDEFTQMEELMNFRFFMESSVVCSKEDESIHDHIDDESLELMLKDIYTSIARNEYRTLEHRIEFLIASMRSGKRFSSMYAKLLFTEILKKIVESQGKRNSNLLKNGFERIALCNSIAELKQVILSVFQEHLQRIETATDDHCRKVIEDVQTLIQMEYGSDIGVDYLAKRVFLSPSYLSFLFKKSTGQSLVKYITAVRMERAKELLRDSTIKVVDIASRVGFANTSYFNLMFKQYNGLTPVQYREVGGRR
ncbi:response regulator [Paenibacillus sp. PL91]|uniref:response regulator transcription factor n=1 Tax=Paenibacillus sp. PL91 TaxID=2729538 RepID=UPI00145D9CA1|nr:response regulator [Paenibacillus sp. PL91]MBC9199225.1 response regulator [Paenibacillus sp. PL91]